jgi:hypothetical protein
VVESRQMDKNGRREDRTPRRASATVAYQIGFVGGPVALRIPGEFVIAAAAAATGLTKN